MPSPFPLIDRGRLPNDDGIEAPGLAVLERVAARIAREVWVVAPQTDQSGTSHSVTLHEPLRAIRYDDRRYAITGTPGDCAVMGVRHLLRDAPPELILSGINRGANLGVETVFSGTVGAAMTGMLLGVRSIALSQAFTDGQPLRWDTAEALAGEVIGQLLATRWNPQVCLNVNFPDVPAEQVGPLSFTRQGVGMVESIGVEVRQDPRGQDYHWLTFSRAPREDYADSEARVVRDGGIAVTPLRFERTDDQVLAELRGQASH